MDNYVGLTIRTEVLEKNRITVNISILKTIAVAAAEYYCKTTQTARPEIKIERAYPKSLGIEEYEVRPGSNLRIRLSLEPENYAPFNSWLEVDHPNSKEWALLVDLACYLSRKFPDLIFNVSSSFFANPDCAETEKYTNIFQNGRLIEQLTRQEWAEKYLGAKYL